MLNPSETSGDNKSNFSQLLMSWTDFRIFYWGGGGGGGVS